MGLTYVRKLSRSELGAETLPCEGRKMKYGGIDKFHMQRNPWCSSLYSAKPSEFYNPIWTGIPMEEYNPRLSEHVVSGDIHAWRRKMKEREKDPQKKTVPVEPRPYRSFYVPPPESSSSSSTSTLSRIIAECVLSISPSRVRASNDSSLDRDIPSLSHLGFAAEPGLLTASAAHSVAEHS